MPRVFTRPGSLQSLTASLERAGHAMRNSLWGRAEIALGGAVRRVSSLCMAQVAGA